MSLSDFSIRNSVFAWMLFAGLVLFGLLAARRMGVSEMPDVDLPVVSVSVTYEGAAPAVMETDVVDIIEESVMTIQGIRNVSSTSRQSNAHISIEFELDRNIDAALQEVQTKLAQAQHQLPADIDPPVVTKTNPEDQPIMWLSLTSALPTRERMAYARDHIKDKLQTVNGVGEVIMGGYLEPALRVWVDPKKMAAREVTVTDLLDTIEREHTEAPAGRLETPTTESNLRVLGEAYTPEAFGHLAIGRRGGAAIYRTLTISDVGTVEAGLNDERRLSRTNGEPAVGFGIKKQRGENAVRVAQAVRERLETINQQLPSGMKLQVNFDATRFIEAATHEMRFHLLFSALLTAVVCLAFLASLRATFNILLAIPASIIGSFLALGFLGFTLNTFTLLGLMLAIGLVVDDAIMVLENIVRHHEMGKPAVTAASDGAREITPAAVATTLSLIAIFCPVIFMQGVIGKFFYQFGVTISVAIALSLLDAVTLTPMRSAVFLAGHDRTTRSAQRVHAFFGRLMQGYLRGLRWCLVHRWTVIGGSLLLFVASFALLGGLRKEFAPPQDQAMLLVRFQTPLGSSLAFTDARMQEVEKIIAQRPEVARYFSAIGGFGGGEVNTGMMFLSLKPRGERPVDPVAGHRLSQQELMGVLRKAVAPVHDIRAIFQDMSTRGLTAQRGFPIEFTVRGPDWTQLARFAEQIVARMKADPLFADIDTDYQAGQPEVQIIPRRAVAAARGVSAEEIGKTVNALMGGVRAGKFTEAGHRVDIRVQAIAAARAQPKDIADLLTRNRYGELIPLRELVDIREEKTLSTITRKDRERAIGLFANVAPGQSQAQALAAVQQMASTILPAGYHAVFTGSSKTFQDSFRSLLFALILGIVVAYMVLASQYNSFVHPFTVLLALPFSLSGALVALALTNNSLNIYSFIGLILLMGIAKKNSILLVDFTTRRRREGLPLTEALLTACPQRLRPILMTSLATIAAAIPPALGIGLGAETRVPMAVVVIGGVVVSTVLTLFVVPCAYSLLARLERKQYL